MPFLHISTQISDRVALQLPVLTLKLHTTPLFRPKALSSVSTKKKNFPNCYQDISTVFSFLLSTSHNYLQCFLPCQSVLNSCCLPKCLALFFTCQNVLNCTTFGITMQDPLVLFCKKQNIFLHRFFSDASAVTPEPLHTCSRTNCSSSFFFETKNRGRKNQVFPALGPCNAGGLLPLSPPFTLVADR